MRGVQKLWVVVMLMQIFCWEKSMKLLYICYAIAGARPFSANGQLFHTSRYLFVAPIMWNETITNQDDQHGVLEAFFQEVHNQELKKKISQNYF